MGMRRILIVGAGDFQLPLVQYASRDCLVYLAAPAIPREFLPYVHAVLLTDVRDKEAILAFAKGANPNARKVEAEAITAKPVCDNATIDGVITDQTDIPVRTVAYVAEALDLPGIGLEASRLFTDKALMRARMRELGMPLLPSSAVSSLEEALDFFAEIGGSVIVKPVDSQGSRGVAVCNSAAELADKFPQAARWTSPDADGRVVVERRATGREFVVEGMAVAGAFRNLCIGDTEYFDLPDVFAAKTRVFPSNADSTLQRRVLDLNARIIEGFGLKQGLSHSEFIMDGDEIYLIESAARGGGVFISSDLISLACGLKTEEFLIGLALGDIARLEDVPGIEADRLAEEPCALAENPLCWCGYLSCFVPQGLVESVAGIREVLSLPYVHRNQLPRLASLQGKRQCEGNVDKTSRYALTVSADSEDELHERFDMIRRTLRAEVLSADEEYRGLIWE